MLRENELNFYKFYILAYWKCYADNLPFYETIGSKLQQFIESLELTERIGELDNKVKELEKGYKIPTEYHNILNLDIVPSIYRSEAISYNAPLYGALYVLGVNGFIDLFYLIETLFDNYEPYEFDLFNNLSRFDLLESYNSIMKGITYEATQY